MSEEYEEYAEATPEQKRQIATYFVLSSPSGEVKDVLNDVRTLVSDSVALDDATVSGMMANYNVKHYTAAKLPAGDAAGKKKALVTPFGQVSETRYVDPSSGKVYEFDHVKQEFTAETDQRVVLPDAVEKYRAAAEAAVRAYVGSFYAEGKCVEGVYGTDDAKITVCLSAANSRLRSFWTGGMRCTYTFDASSPGPTEVAGAVNINVHYFEDGNVQLNSDFKRSERLEVTADADATAKALVALIEKIEGEFQRDLEEMYIALHSDTFKAMRRVLPVSRQKFNWDANVHSLASQVSGGNE